MFNTISGQQNTGGADLPLLISANMAAKTLGISPRSLWTLTELVQYACQTWTALTNGKFINDRLLEKTLKGL